MPTAHARLGSLRARTERRTVAAANGDAGLTGILVASSLLAAWMVSFGAGGSQTALPHAFYVPVIVGAIRFRARGALLVALAAGIAAGPLLPLDVAEGTDQDTANWVTRLVAFVLIGQLTAYLSRHSLPSLSDELAARRLRTEIDEAIEGSQLRLEYQPIVHVDDGSLAGVEALLRWDHPTRGPIPPCAFIPRAEAAGCMAAITAFVLDEACRQVAAWRETILRDRAQFKFAINISGHDLCSSELVDRVAETLADTGLPPWWVHLEITETALVLDVPVAIHSLAAFRELGVRLAIDDFGTGESSLGYLDQFLVDLLKVDRLFLRRIGDDHDDALNHGMVAMAHAMDLAVVAEGVETDAQARAVSALGYDYAQGYLFSRPLTPSALEDLLATPDRFRRDNSRHLGGTPVPALD